MACLVIMGMVVLSLTLVLGPTRLVRTIKATAKLWKDALLA